jgi:ABC-type transport system involved in multi-copper enzyme maturation permease subunit
MFAALRSFFSFPLLAKELTERAARPRTYWMRIGAGLLLYVTFWLSQDKLLKRSSMGAIFVLGTGEYMFQTTVRFLFLCIAAFVPAMLCGVITHEKERDSLSLLLLTRMRPWQIVIQKYLGGLIPALTILLLAMPLVAVAYAYGGVTATDLMASLVILVLSILQVGAIAVWASCQFRTTVASFLATYFVAGALFTIPGLVLQIGREFNRQLVSKELEWFVRGHYPPVVFQEGVGGLWGAADFRKFLIGCAMVTSVGLVFLVLAIIQLPRRAFDRPTNRLRPIFAAIDRWYHAANRRIGGVKFGRKDAALPGNLPIVWREKRARALARPEYLVRLLVVIMFPIVLLSLIINDRSAMVPLLSGLAILVLCTTAANGIVNERVSQTFDVLLTTPMSAANILRQKVRALRPLTIVLAVPVLAECTLKFLLDTNWEHRGKLHYPHWIYPVCVALTASVYPPLSTWFAVWMGLWCKTRLRAIVTTLVLLIVWMVGPTFIASESGIPAKGRNLSRYLHLLSPITVPALNEVYDLDDLEPNGPWKPVVFNFALYGGIFLLIRTHCLRKADWYLRR